jgi:phage host-nuclease inhibitor protein Gam
MTTDTMTNTLIGPALTALMETDPAGDDRAQEADAFMPDTADKADWVLGKIADARARAARIRENMELMAREADREAEGLHWRFGAALQTFLRAELEGGKKKSLRLPNGVLGYRTKPAGVSVTDPAAALAWARENLPGAVLEALDKKALTEALLATGEALPFAALNAAEETFYIR